MQGGTNKFILGRNVIAFLHPTLRDLTLSCFDIGDDLESVLSQASGKTLLRSLTFDECNITHSGLAAVLSMPRALENLILGERIYHTRWTHSNLQSDPRLLLQILESQKDTLQYLKHVGGSPWDCGITGSVHGLSLAFLASLQVMELSTRSVFTRIAKGCSPLLPPKLQTLRLLEPRQGIAFGIHLGILPLVTPPGTLQFHDLADATTWVQDISLLDVVLSPYGSKGSITEEFIETVWSKEHRWDTLQKVAAYLAGKGVKRVRVLFSYGSTHIPPYLYGEPLPKEAVVLDFVIPLTPETHRLFSTASSARLKESSPVCDNQDSTIIH
jgi:hypothetical protein